MSLPEDKEQHDLQLRAAAEQQIDSAPQTKPGEHPGAELLHELKVHQVELEIQNELLRETQIALLESRDRYADLYEFAPVGYINLGADGMIAAINLTATTLLGLARKALLRRAFMSLVVADDLNRWILHFQEVKKGGGQGQIELGLQRDDGAVRRVSR